MPTVFESLEKEIDDALAVHLLWKQKIDEALETKVSSLSVEQAKSDHLCAFGRWIYGDGLPDSVGKSVSYFNIQALHNEFHNRAATLLEFALKSDDRADAEYVILLSVYEQSSAALVRALQEWKTAEVRALFLRGGADL